MTSAEINSPSGKTYLARLKALCEASGTLPTSLMLPGGLGDLGTKPTNSSSSADIYRATYKGREVAVKTLRVSGSSSVHKVRAQRSAYIIALIGSHFSRG